MSARSVRKLPDIKPVVIDPKHSLANFGRGVLMGLIRPSILVLIFSISAIAQTSTGRIAGTVTDPSGAAINGATILVLDERPNQERTTASNEDGIFTFSGLDPSHCPVRAEQSGFSAVELKKLSL